MKKTITCFAAAFFAGTALVAAPQAPSQRPAPEIKKPTPKPAAKPAVPAPAKKPAKPAPAPAKKPAKPAPAPIPVVKPAPVPPAPVLPPPPPVVVYQPVRNTYTIQLNADNAIIFEQRLVGLQELKEKIRMVSNDRPRPQIIVKVGFGVPEARTQYAIKLLKDAGFHDTSIVRLTKRVKFQVKRWK